MVQGFRPCPKAAGGIGGNVRVFDIGPTVLTLASEDGTSWTVTENHMLVMENPRSKRARGGIQFLPCFMGRRIMRSYGMILHWDFGRNSAYLEISDKLAI